MLANFLIHASLFALFARHARARLVQLTQPPVTGVLEAAHSIPVQQHDLDAISIASVLVTAIPYSLRQVAATNVPEFSSILRDEFLDEKKPSWFLELPLDIQGYLISQLGAQPSVDATTPLVLFPPSTISVTSPVRNTLSTPGLVPSRFSVSTESGWATQTAPAHTTRVQSLPTSNSTRNTPPYVTPYATTLRSGKSDGLTQHQRIGIAVGIPFAVFGLGVLGLVCFFFRQRRQKNINGSTPPSSPDFIPRFAFHQKEGDTDLYRPLTRHDNYTARDADYPPWGPPLTKSTSIVETPENAYPPPILCHTHSSNRARGKRTSYTSLKTLPETTELDDKGHPVVARWKTASGQPIALALPPAFQIRRKPLADVSVKPVGTTPTNMVTWDTACESTPAIHCARDVSPETHHPSSLGLPSLFEASILRVPRFGERADRAQPYGEDDTPGQHNEYANGERVPRDGYTSNPQCLLPEDAPDDWPLMDRLNSCSHQQRTVLWDRVYKT